jgi:hypothetical protein
MGGPWRVTDHDLLELLSQRKEPFTGCARLMIFTCLLATQHTGNDIPMKFFLAYPFPDSIIARSLGGKTCRSLPRRGSHKLIAFLQPAEVLVMR